MRVILLSLTLSWAGVGHAIVKPVKAVATVMRHPLYVRDAVANFYVNHIQPRPKPDKGCVGAGCK